MEHGNLQKWATNYVTAHKRKENGKHDSIQVSLQVYCASQKIIMW